MAKFNFRWTHAPARLPPGLPHRINSNRFRPSADGCAELRLSIHFAHHDIDAPEDDHHVSNSVTEAQIFQNGEIDKAWRTHTIAIRIRTAIADQIKSELALRRFNSAIVFSNWRTKSSNLHLLIRDRAGLNLPKRLLENFHAFMHLERAHHQSIVSVAVVAQRNAKFEPWIKSVAVHFPNVVIYAGST